MSREIRTMLILLLGAAAVLAAVFVSPWLSLLLSAGIVAIGRQPSRSQR